MMANLSSKIDSAKSIQCGADGGHVQDRRRAMIREAIPFTV